MNNPVLYQVGLGVLTLFFFFLMYKFTKTWRWLHVTVMFFVYCAAIAFLFYASLTMKTHHAWRTVVNQRAEEAEKLKSENDLLLHGDINLVSPTTPPIRDLHAELGRVLLDRGRVWRNCQPGPPAQDGTVTVNTVPPGVADADAPPNRIDQHMILYVFTESPAPPDLAPTLRVSGEVAYPHYYVGEFTASAVTDKSVTLTPTLPITNFERAMLSIQGVTWSLYETMPVDGHNVFADDPKARPDLTKDADVEPVFGRHDEQRIASLLARAARIQGETDEQFLQRYAGILAQYHRDGKRAADDDAPLNRWLKVRFTAPHEEIVDVAQEATVGFQSSQSFFNRGNAEIAWLRRGEPAKFKKNDIGVFPGPGLGPTGSTAEVDQLIRQGKCELIEPIYVRSLHSYDYAFHDIYQQVKRLEQDVARVQRNTASVTEAARRVQVHIDYRTKERDGLQEDSDKFAYELEQIKQYHDRLEARVNEKLAELSQLYRSNYQLASELAQIERELTEKINRRTQEAIAEVP